MASFAVSSFSNQLVEEWSQFLPETPTTNLESNARTALGNFSTFKESYEQTIKDYFDEKFPATVGTTEAEKRRRGLWLTEQINLALDLFWEPLARATEQLKSAPYDKFFANDSKLSDALTSFKINVKEAFGGKANHLVDNILIYFDKTTRINRYPYTKIALIGIPYRVFTQDSNERKTWMPIAHELGHHIYWNMASYSDLAEQKKKFENEVLKKLEYDFKPTPTKGAINLMRPWIGEIFADAIGLRISGKDDERQTFIDTCKELILRKTDNKQANLSLDDADHVPDGLRLLVPLASLGVSDPIGQWKEFLKTEAGKEADKINLIARNKEGELLSSTLNAVKEKVPEQICNTVRIILDEVAKFKEDREESLFTIPSSSFSPSVTAEKLLEAAKYLGKGDPNASLTIALNPEILEGEQAGPRHTHTWTTDSPHSHRKTESHRH